MLRDREADERDLLFVRNGKLAAVGADQRNRSDHYFQLVSGLEVPESDPMAAWHVRIRITITSVLSAGN